MRPVLAIAAGMAGLATGWAAAAALTILLGNLAGVPDRDGGYAMMAFFAIGPVGGLFGFGAAMWLAGLVSGRRGARPFVTRTLVAAAGTAGIAIAVGAGFWMTRPNIVANRLPPELVFQIRMPEGAVPPPLVSRDEALRRRSPIELTAGDSIMSATVEQVSDEAGRPLVAGRVELSLRTRDRILVLKRGNGDIVFDIRLAAVPGHAATFGEWQHPVGVGGSTGHGVDEGYEIRYRADWPGQE